MSAPPMGSVRLRRQRQCTAIWWLGARALFELVDELSRYHALPDLDIKLERYARLDPSLLRAVGADRFAAAPIHLVVGGQRLAGGER
jgi:hypothetical protein